MTLVSSYDHRLHKRLTALSSESERVTDRYRRDRPSRQEWKNKLTLNPAKARLFMPTQWREEMESQDLTSLGKSSL